MVFKRRDRRPLWKVVADFVYPRGGWTRAYHYVKHRLRRLPDPPHRIARGIFAGVFACFTPFFGLHFVVAVIVARLMSGNIIASLLATFFGNPVTFPIIGAVSLKLGHLILGSNFEYSSNASLVAKFLGAWRDIGDNFLSLFTRRDADWQGLTEFYREVFLPYLVGGIVPGIIVATTIYYLLVPVIAAYQNRRKGRLKAKLEELRRKKLAKKAAEAHASERTAAQGDNDNDNSAS